MKQALEASKRSKPPVPARQPPSPSLSKANDTAPETVTALEQRIRELEARLEEEVTARIQLERRLEALESST